MLPLVFRNSSECSRMRRLRWGCSPMRKQINSSHAMRKAMAMIALLACMAMSVAAQQAPQGAVRYQKPPQAVLDVLDAPAPMALSVNPTRDHGILAEPVRYPPIAELAQPMLRLAGLRINPATNGPHRATRYVRLWLKRVSDGSEIKLTLPAEPSLSLPVWSPDGG